MIIDIHTHVFPVAVCTDRARFFEDEPAFRLLYDSPGSQLVGAADTLAMMDAQGVDKSVIFGFPWRNIETCRQNNDAILEAVTRHPDRLLGFCCVDPLHPGAADEVERCLQAGLHGIGELAFYTSGIDGRCLDSLAPIMALARRFDRPVMLHTNEPVGHQYPGKSPNTLAQIYALVRRFFDNRLILAHWGGGIFFYALLKKEVREALANVWFDTAASPYLYRPQIYSQALDLAGEEKILMGSDFPLLQPERYFKEMDQAGLSAARKRSVCGANAARLLGLE
ncbi:MAG: amidohydrolase family protein [Desulfocapsaceae bacterium]|nr:amidohydrolase family protein [Desulfocapsaceae bacterium]